MWITASVLFHVIRPPAGMLVSVGLKAWPTILTVDCALCANAGIAIKAEAIDIKRVTKMNFFIDLFKTFSNLSNLRH